jgi:hypothetical protein
VDQSLRPHPPHLHQAEAPPIAPRPRAHCEALELPGDKRLTIITYAVEPATPSPQALQLLSNWADEAIPEGSLKNQSDRPLDQPRPHPHRDMVAHMRETLTVRPQGLMAL